MANSPPIKFYKSSQSSYDNLISKDSNCFYYTSDENNLYLGDSLLSGNNGIGIANVEQTTSSSENGGINIWTVTLTDGREYIFTVYNGNSYTLTDDDKNEIASLVFDMFVDGDEVSY